jgi:sulfur-carrier protein adenylyltransferase/sulfurtransferase
MFGIGKNSDKEISVAELKARLDMGEKVFILDVREEGEYKFCNLGGYHLPLRDLPKRVNELDPKQEIIVMCHSGARSARAVQFLRQAGFSSAKNLTGGIDKWAREIDPGMPRY